MLYSMFDKFIVRGILCQVKYVNAGKAWVVPTENVDLGDGRTLYDFVVFDVLNEKGLDSQGNKALVVNNSESGAV